MQRNITVQCPAKVNLFLAVGPRDDRGYHPLRTIFQAVDLCDTLQIEVDSTEPGFFCDDPAVPEENTVTKALELLRAELQLPPIRISLTKRIPAESGLGGGSSDAAGLLRALGSELPREDLMRMAELVGADVPFFLIGGRARAVGYGEQLKPLPDAPAQWLVVARPDVGCPTGEAYRKLDELSYPWKEFSNKNALYNDFERVAPCECLDLIERLRVHGARDAALSGSGSAVFGRFTSELTAIAATDALGAEGFPHAWAVQTLTREASLRISG